MHSSGMLEVDPMLVQITQGLILLIMASTARDAEPSKQWRDWYLARYEG
jgi:hypothetical protein